MSAHTITRADREAANETLRLKVETCAPYTTVHPSSFASSEYSFRQILDMLRKESLEYVDLCDMLVVPDEVTEEHEPIKVWLNRAGRWVRNLLEGCRCIPASSVPKSLADLFDPKGADASVIERRSVLREFKKERSHWVDLLIRAHTLHHNGTPTEQPLVHEISPSYAINSRTRFQDAAREYRVPTEAEILSKMPAPGKSQTTHPYLAAGRFLTVTGLRAVAEKVKALQEDSSVSSSGRDKGAYGDRSIHQLKDLGHQPVAPPEHIEPGTKIVHTLFDCLGYENQLARHSGHDMIIWASYYPELAGETRESTYYADSTDTFVEIIGKYKATAQYRKQYPWDFTANDIVYIENEDRSAFTVYNVIRYPQPEQLKQVVFLCALQTVNLPYYMVDRLVRWTKGHDLASVGISTPRRCNNVVLVPRDPTKPYTQDILVMANGTPGRPTASVKYVNETSPRSCTTISTELFHHLRYLNSHGGRGLSVNEVTKRLEIFALEGVETSVPGSAAYCELLRTVAWWGKLPNVVYYDKACEEKDVPTEDTNAKAYLGAPLITQGDQPCVTVKGGEATKAYVDHKLLGMQNTTVPPSDYAKISNLVLDTWIQCVAEESMVKKGTLQLVDRELILEHRTKAVQRAREITDGLGTLPEIARCEQKTEVLHKTPVCPRHIQNPVYDISILSGVLGKTMEQVLKQCSWYSPGLSTEDMAKSVAESYELSSMHELRHEGGGMRGVDYTAADEGHSEHSNRIDRRFLEYFMCNRDRELALWIYDQCFHMPLQVGPKVMSSKWKNASGTGITTVLNTTAFCERELETTLVAMVFKSMEHEGSLQKGDTPKELKHRDFIKHLHRIQEKWLPNITTVADRDRKSAIRAAYHWVGPKFGDDGLAPATPYVDDDTWTRAMHFVDKMDGFTRKLDVSAALLEEPVEYLSRIYPCPTRVLTSYCKVEKAVNKLSIAINGDPERYFLKLRGYWTVDSRTPIVGAYVTAVANMYGITLEPLGDGSILTTGDLDGELRRLYEEERELYMKVAGGPIPWSPSSEQELYDSVAAEYGMTSVELREYDADLRSQSTWRGIRDKMLPRQLLKKDAVDPLGLYEQPEPEGIARVAAFKGPGPRLCDLHPICEETAHQDFDDSRTDAALRVLEWS
uniref:RNA replicase n=1 Tax=Beihai noda-like virus 22 TaxID=1922476 RepID=A0A1L3KFZ5_9VIRU|nr:hypothetical protein 1 [Beihai noda-like virus 22]